MLCAEANEKDHACSAFRVGDYTKILAHAQKLH